MGVPGAGREILTSIYLTSPDVDALHHRHVSHKVSTSNGPQPIEGPDEIKYGGPASCPWCRVKGLGFRA